MDIVNSETQEDEGDDEDRYSTPPVNRNDSYATPAIIDGSAPARAVDNPVRSSVGVRGTIEAPTEWLVSVQCTHNNIMITVNRPKDEKSGPCQPVHKIISGGNFFKGQQRSTYEAGYQCSLRLFQVLEEARQKQSAPLSVAVSLKGFGQGRDAFKTALTGIEGQVVREWVTSISDHTPIKIGGPRGKKARRL